MFLLTLVALTASAADAPLGTADKSMYDLSVTGVGRMDLGTGGAVAGGIARKAVSERVALGVGGLWTPDHGVVSPGTTQYVEAGCCMEKWGSAWGLGESRGEFVVDYGVVGDAGQGWRLTGGLEGSSFWSKPAVPLRFNPGFTLDDPPKTHGLMLMPKLGTAYQWVFHPGFTFRIDAGALARGLYLGREAHRLPNDVVPYAGVSLGWSFVTDGPAPRPGYRGRAHTGHRPPEVYAVGALAVTALGVAALAFANPFSVKD